MLRYLDQIFKATGYTPIVGEASLDFATIRLLVMI